MARRHEFGGKTWTETGSRVQGSVPNRLTERRGLLIWRPMTPAERTGQPVVWLLVDDRAGNASQCLGVAEALGLRYLKQDLRYTASANLPNFIIGPTFGHLTRDSRVNLAAPWPDLVVAAGRRTAPVALNIKQKSGGKTFLAQIMYPGDSGAEDFDLIAVPRHDQMPPQPNLLEITGAPHRVTASVLADAAAQWRDRLAHLPAPCIALIVGGSTKRRTFTDAMAAELGRLASDMAAGAGGSLMVATSRRTGDAAAALIDAVAVPSHVYRWGDEGDNPYMGYLGLADAVVVTGDSVSMCSEACATPGPVYIHAPKKLTVLKHARLHQELFEAGYARPLDGTLSRWTHPPLNAADTVAAEIRSRMGLG